MLLAVRPLFSPTSFQFRENGKVVGEMERSRWRETAELDYDDGRYSFYRDQVTAVITLSNVAQRSTFRRTGLCSTVLFLLALLVDVEAATGLDDPDYLDETDRSCLTSRDAVCLEACRA